MSKHFIKDKLGLENGKFTLLEFDELAKKIHKSMKDTDYTEGKVKKTMARYSKIKNNCIMFDTSFNSELDYHQLKEKIKQSENLSHRESQESKPKKSTKNKQHSSSNKTLDYENLLMGINVNDNNSDGEKPKSKSTNNKQSDKQSNKNYEDLLMGINVNNNSDDEKSKSTNKQINKNNKDDSDDEDKNNSDKENDDNYIYSLESSFVPKKRDPPFGTDWINDKKIKNDELTKVEKKRSEKFEKLAKLKFPPQKSQEWLNLRKSVVSASDGGCTLGDNDYEPQHKLLYKKVIEPPFEPNENCYHGNKYEEIATMTYSYRMNVEVREFGLIKHPKCEFLGASPDGIITPYKCDGRHLTKFVGRMLEIKCPTSREIKTTGEIKGNICPIYYWDQVQLQLECCDLDECDFWQCKITEYDTRQEFIEDTNPKEPFRSKTTGYEKGCVIQVLPLSKRMDAQSLKLQIKKHIKDNEKMTDEEKNQPQHFEEVDNGDDREIKMERYYNIVYESSKHIYPPKIDMTPYEIDEWIIEVTNNFHKQKLLDNNLNIRDYYIDKVIFWKIEKTHCVTINRDKEWFESVKPTIAKMWKYVEFLRDDKEKGSKMCETLFGYTESVTEHMEDYKNPKKIKEKKMTVETKNLIKKVVDEICNPPDMEDTHAKKKYFEKIEKIKQRTIQNNEMKESNKNKNKNYSKIPLVFV